jgi:hypothetical protein
MLKYGIQQKGGCAALKIPAMYPLRLGQDKPVRQLKKAGRMEKSPC